MGSASYAADVLQRCDQLALCSEEPDRLTRRYGTPALREAQALVAGWMEAAGLTVQRDNIGNLIGRRAAASPDAPTLLLGSHIDTVPGAGKYDGPLGVMVGLAALQELHDQNMPLPYAVELVAFADEEGARFGAAYLGSRALAGSFDPADLARTDRDGVSLAEAVRAFGGHPDRIASDRWHGGPLLGYCEAHIEQGPRLEAAGLPVGVVSAIAGQSRYAVRFAGEPGHAGTVPMELRRDALCAAAEFVLAVEAEARATEGLVATVGQVAVEPGAVNVIPAAVAVSLDVRHQDDDVRTAALERIASRLREIGSGRRLTAEWQLLLQDAAVRCDPQLSSVLAGAVAEAGYPVQQLPSGAGHDAAVIARLCPIAMLFVRCRRGISHSPDESVTEMDVSVAIDVLGRFLRALVRTSSPSAAV